MWHMVNSIVDALERAPAIVVPLIRQAPAATIKQRPPSGKWSIHEHACHLADVDLLMVRRLDTILSQATPVIQSYDPGRDEADDRLLHVKLDEVLERYTGAR